MGQKVNRKARFQRHLRILKENTGKHQEEVKKNNKGTNYSHILVALFVLFLLPIYPRFSSAVYGNTQYDFYRGDIDEQSILEFYYGDNILKDEDIDSPMLESSDSFLSVKTILNDERNLEGINEIVDYEVKPGESFYAIAYKFKVSTNSIYWANDFGKDHVLHPGDTIKIPPVSGLIHQVKKGDTVKSISKYYNIDEEKILAQNGLESNVTLAVDDVLVVPGAVKKVKKPVYKKPPAKYISGNSGGGYSFAKYASSQYVSAGGAYKLTWRKPQHTFYWGNCTRYVGQYKNVNWGGNANQWLKNAKAKGHPTGLEPTLGSIVVFQGRGYNPRYGHVGIVMDIQGSHIIVSDMNYRKLNEVTYRKVPISDRAIRGYIYVD